MYASVCLRSMLHRPSAGDARTKRVTQTLIWVIFPVVVLKPPQAKRSPQHRFQVLPVGMFRSLVDLCVFGDVGRVV